MMIIKLERDHARSVQQYFFPFLEMLCKTKLKDAQGIDDQLNCRVILSIFDEVVYDFDKKLFTTAAKFTFKLSDAQGITLYKLLMLLPINSREVFLINLRSMIIDTLHRQMCEPVTPG